MRGMCFFLSLVFSCLLTQVSLSASESAAESTIERTAESTAERTVECWTAAEWEFESAGDFTEKEAFYHVQLDVEFRSEKGTVLRMPAFWDGGKTWRVRFAPTEPGTWSFTSVCSETGDPGLHGKKGTFQCVPYTGELEIYRRGFIQTREGRKYLVYADGTPFFYLGDTHWGMMSEEFDEPGPHAGELKIQSHFCYLVDRRAEQGFTVYQSEPIGKTMNFADGISMEDVRGFQSMDRYFRHIAHRGLVHANAQFFYPSEMLAIQHDEAYLKLLTRYWVARYAAYPVLWTLGQEVDDDFYEKFSRDANPYVKVCTWIHELDPYRHPMTAHQENIWHTTRSGVGKAHASIFQDVPGHTWYGVQWSLRLNSPPNTAIAKDYWNDGKGKPAILYEGLYCFLWTEDFGARAQGWMAFLNGMYGYGYGAADIWLYRGKYDMNTTSTHDGVSQVTPEEKALRWPEALELPSASQVIFMKDFLKKRAWWELIPEFAVSCEGPEAGRKMEFVPASPSVFRFAAHAGHREFVFYFYSRAKETGTLQGLEPGTGYACTWFDPQTGRSLETVMQKTGPSGVLELPQKPDEKDWVLSVDRK